MATPDDEVRKLLNALSESSLSAVATQALIAIDELIETDPQSPTERMETGRRQLQALRESVLVPLKRELEATRDLPELAKRLGLKPTVYVLADEKVAGEATRLVSLTGAKRVDQLEKFIAVFATTMNEVELNIVRREERRL